MMTTNFYPQQYAQTNTYRINHNYLAEQFADYDMILTKIAQVIRRGDFTLGEAVNRLEQDFAQFNGGQFGIGVGSGTDALFLSLKALDIGAGDEVITTPFTFFATIGAIVTAGAKPVFVDIAADHNIDVSKIEAAITPKTKAMMPVHWAGVPCDMSPINTLAKVHGLAIIADACHAIGASYQQKRIAHWADISCFSMHPLKNLNVWGDGGLIVTNNPDIREQLTLMRNHGLVNREQCKMWAYNSRLDTIQAVVAQHLLDNKMSHINQQRLANAVWLDKALCEIPQITLPPRAANQQNVYHLYMARFEHRDDLQRFLQHKNIDAKIHYPIPMHLQPAALHLGHKTGDYPQAEMLAKSCLSLPIHEFVTGEELEYMVHCIREFYDS